MPIEINDAILTRAPRALDGYSFAIDQISGRSIPYNSVAEALVAIPEDYRHHGQAFFVLELDKLVCYRFTENHQSDEVEVWPDTSGGGVGGGETQQLKTVTAQSSLSGYTFLTLNFFLVSAATTSTFITISAGAGKSVVCYITGVPVTINGVVYYPGQSVIISNSTTLYASDRSMSFVQTPSNYTLSTTVLSKGASLLTNSSGSEITISCPVPCVYNGEQKAAGEIDTIAGQGSLSIISDGSPVPNILSSSGVVASQPPAPVELNAQSALVSSQAGWDALTKKEINHVVHNISEGQNVNILLSNDQSLYLSGSTSITVTVAAVPYSLPAGSVMVYQRQSSVDYVTVLSALASAPVAKLSTYGRDFSGTLSFYKSPFTVPASAASVNVSGTDVFRIDNDGRTYVIDGAQGGFVNRPIFPLYTPEGMLYLHLEYISPGPGSPLSLFSGTTYASFLPGYSVRENNTGDKTIIVFHYNTITSKWEAITDYPTPGALGTTRLGFKTVTGDYTVIPGDAFFVIMLNSTIDRTITLPAAGFTEGDQIVFEPIGTGMIVFAAANGATLRSADNLVKTRVRYSKTSAYYIGSGSWSVGGDLA